MKTIRNILGRRQQHLKHLAIIGAVGLIYLLPFLTIPGLASIYLKIDGLEGDVTAEGHKGWIECDSVQWGVGRAISSTVGSGADRETSRPSISEVTLTKVMDQTSVPLFVEATVGKARNMQIHFVQTGADNFETYYEMTLSEALVSGFSQSSGGDRPTESLSINFTKIELKYNSFDAKGGLEGSVNGGYDISSGKGL